MRESFVFYRSFYEATTELTDEQRLAYYDSLIKYAFFDEEPQSGLIKVLFSLSKPAIDAATDRYEKAKRGGRPSSVDPQEVERLKAEGKTVKEIAEILKIAESSVYRILKSVNSQNLSKPLKTSYNSLSKLSKPNDNYNDNYNVDDNDNYNYNYNDNSGDSGCGGSGSKADLTSLFRDAKGEAPSVIELTALENMTKEYSSEAVSEAIRIAALNGRPNVGYINGILRKKQSQSEEDKDFAEWAAKWEADNYDADGNPRTV